MITVLRADDWVAIYVDNELVYGNHSIDVRELLDIIEVEYEQYWIEDYEEWEEKYNYEFPDTLTEDDLSILR